MNNLLKISFSFFVFSLAGLANLTFASGALTPVTPVIPVIPASQNTPASLLTQYLNQINQFSADVTESLITDSGESVKNVGHVWIQKPGKFRYEIHNPEVQTFVSDGKNLYNYEPDLMQVIVRPLDQSISQTPLLLLSGSGEDLAKLFKITEIAGATGDLPDEKVQAFLLIPLDQEGLINQVVLTFRVKNIANTENILESLKVSNSFGQTTVLYFSHIVQNQAAPLDKFIFTVPQGVDVLGG